MSLENGYLMEPSREARLLNRWRLNLSIPKYDIPEAHMQAVVPNAWFRDPIEPEVRRVFYCSMREMFAAASLHFATNTLLITSRCPKVVFHSNISDADKSTARALERQNTPRSQESQDKEAAEARQLLKLFKEVELAGQDQDGEKDMKIKIPVFMINTIPEMALTAFLDTMPDAVPGEASYSYVFPNGIEDSLKGSSIIDEDTNPTRSSISSGTDPSALHTTQVNRVQFMHELATDESDAFSDAEGNDQVEGSDEVNGSTRQGMNTDKGSRSTSSSRSGPSQVIGTGLASIAEYRLRARHYLSQPSRFVDEDFSDIHEFWLQMIEPYSKVPSLYATNVYIILDDQTARDCETVIVVTETVERIHRRRIDFTALKEGIVIKGLESLSFDLDQLPGDWSGVLKGPMMEKARILEEVWNERQRKNEERYYKKNEKDVEGSPTRDEAKEESSEDKAKEKKNKKDEKAVEGENSQVKQKKGWKSKIGWKRNKSTSTSS